MSDSLGTQKGVDMHPGARAPVQAGTSRRRLEGDD